MTAYDGPAEYGADDLLVPIERIRIDDLEAGRWVGTVFDPGVEVLDGTVIITLTADDDWAGWNAPATMSRLIPSDEVGLHGQGAFVAPTDD